jgi:hypothetical protein
VTCACLHVFTSAKTAPNTPEDEEVAAAALAAANANLTPIDEAEITGVDLPTPSPVTDDEDNTNEDEDDDDVIEIGVVAPPAAEVQQLDDDEFEPNPNDNASVDEGDDADDEEDDEDDDEDENFDESPARRYPRRIRKPKERTVIDFENKAYKIQEGVIHLNPAVFENEPPRIRTKADQEQEHSQGMSAKDVTLHIIGVIMAKQYSIKKGLKVFGKEGEKAVTKELSQMHDMVVYTPVHAHELTREQKPSAGITHLSYKKEMRANQSESVREW